MQGKENQDGSESDEEEEDKEEEDGKDEDEEEEKKKEKKKQVVEVADLGCGVARLAATLAGDARFVVHSYDLVAANARVEACNIAHVPLSDGAARRRRCSASDGDRLRAVPARGAPRAAHRRPARRRRDEVAHPQRRALRARRRGARLCAQEADESNTMFVLFRFTKTADARRTLSAHDVRYAERLIDLQPCIYKRR